MKKSAISFFIKEIYIRLMYSVIASGLIWYTSYVYAYELIYIYIKPLNYITNNNIQFIFTSLTESFKSQIYISTVISTYTFVLLLIIHTYFFLIPGLYLSEKKKLKKVTILISSGLILQTIVVQLKIIPLIWKFLLTFEYSKKYDILNISLHAKIFDFLELNVQLLLSFTIIYLIFCIFYAILKNNQINAKNTFKKQRKYIYTITLAIAALIAPPDVISQIIFSVPIIFYYEIALILLLIENNYKKIGEDRIRTCDRNFPTDLQSATLNHSATSPKILI